MVSLWTTEVTPQSPTKEVHFNYTPKRANPIKNEPTQHCVGCKVQPTRNLSFRRFHFAPAPDIFLPFSLQTGKMGGVFCVGNQLGESANRAHSFPLPMATGTNCMTACTLLTYMSVVEYYYGMPDI